MLPLGTVAPEFELIDVVSESALSLDLLDRSKPFLVIFLCCHCPFVKHILDELTRLDKDYSDRIEIVAISANDAAKYPADSPEKLKEMAQKLGWSMRVCYDETQAVAKAYTAACTPDFFLFNSDRHLVYRGQLDESRPSNGLPVTGIDLRAALEAILAHKPISEMQTPSIGCNIKWIPGNEPDYFSH